MMDRALQAVETKMATAGKAEQFEILKPWLVGDTEKLSQAGAAANLNLRPGAVKVAIHRLRGDFRKAVRTEIAHTVGAEGDVNEELQYLIQVLAKSP